MCNLPNAPFHFKVFHLSAKNLCTGCKKDNNCCAIGAAFLGHTRCWLIRTAEIQSAAEMALFSHSQMATEKSPSKALWKPISRNNAHARPHQSKQKCAESQGAAFFIRTNKKWQQTAQVKHWQAEVSVNFAQISNSSLFLSNLSQCAHSGASAKPLLIKFKLLAGTGAFTTGFYQKRLLSHQICEE